MKTNVFVRDSRHVKYWWVSLIAGLLSILVGVLCLVTPDATLVALSMLFIAVLLVDGIWISCWPPPTAICCAVGAGCS